MPSYLIYSLYFKEHLVKYRVEYDPSWRVLESITRNVGKESPYENIFGGLETQHQQLRYFRSNFRLVVSC
jgi:hypothetical protein